LPEGITLDDIVNNLTEAQKEAWINANKEKGITDPREVSKIGEEGVKAAIDRAIIAKEALTLPPGIVMTNIVPNLTEAQKEAWRNLWIKWYHGGMKGRFDPTSLPEIGIKGFRDAVARTQQIPAYQEPGAPELIELGGWSPPGSRQALGTRRAR